VGNRISLLTSLAPVALALAASCLASACAAGASAANAPAGARAGTAVTLPPEPVVTLAGEPTEVARVARGRVALVSLWATWCDGCQREIEALNRLDGSTQDGTGERRDAVVIGVAVGEPRAEVAAFVNRHGLRYTQLVDEDFRFADALGERHVPATLVLDRSGRIVYRGDAFDSAGLAAMRDALSHAD
jgi:peroxiredoxin